MAFTVFYLWQGDRDQKAGRFLIRDAAQRAVNRIAADGTIEDAPALDFDTKGEPGTPDIIEAILRKIERCGLVLADVTFVGETQAESEETAKRLPNPNVLIELGYAIRVLGWKRILLVMNTAFGSPGELPFDLSRRSWPIRYEFTSRSSKKRSEVVEELSRFIEDRIRDTIGAGVLPKKESPAVKLEAARELGEGRRLEFHQRVKTGNFADISPDHGALALCVIPASGPKNPIDWAKAEQKLTRQLQPLGTSGWDCRVGGNYLRTFRKHGDSNANRAATEIDDLGMIAAARAEILFEEMNPGGAVDTKTKWINASQRAGELVAGIGRYLAVLRQLGIEPPWFIGFALLGLGSCRLRVDPLYGNDEAVTFEGYEIVAPLITVEFDSEALKTDEGIVALVRPALDYVAREFNYIRFPGS